MSSPTHSESGRRFRRALLALVVAALVVTAGCSSVPGMGGDGDAGSGPALDTVPAEATAVGYVDVQGTLNDDAVRTVLDEVANMTSGPSGPEDADDALEQAESNSGLDMSELVEVTAFTRSAAAAEGDAEYTGAVIAADWTEEELVAAVRNGTDDDELTETSHAGYDVYHTDSDDSWLGVLGDGRYVVGTEAAVTDALDVAAGDADAFSGDVRSAFEATGDGHVRFASTVPQDELGDVSPGMGGTGGSDVFSDVQTVSGSFATVDGDLSLSLQMAFPTASDATDARNVLNGSVTAYRGMAPDNTTKEALSPERLSIETDGSALVVTSTNPPETYVDVLEMLFLFGGMNPGY